MGNSGMPETTLGLAADGYHAINGGSAMRQVAIASAADGYYAGYQGINGQYASVAEGMGVMSEAGGAPGRLSVRGGAGSVDACGISGNSFQPP